MPKNIIDISKYTALDEFRTKVETYISRLDKNEEKKKLTKAGRWTEIADSIFDFKLRGILSAILCFGVKPKDDDVEIDIDIFVDRLVSQLNFSERQDIGYEDYVKATKEFLMSNKIKTKLFNTIFPHGIHETSKINDKGTSGINRIYLQHMSDYHELILDGLVHGKKEADIVKEVVTLYIKTHAKKNKKIVDFYNDYHPCDHSKELDKYITSTKYVFDTDKTKNDESKKIIKGLCKQVSIVKSFCYVFAAGVSESNMTEDEIEECYAKYQKALKTIKTYHDSLKKPPTNVYDFTKFLVESVSMIGSIFNYNEAKNGLKLFTRDIKINNLSNGYKQYVNKIIKGDIDISIIVNNPDDNRKFTAPHIRPNSDKTYNGDVFNITSSSNEYTYNALSKIGLYGGNDIMKEIRAGIGVGIIDYIMTAVEYIAAGSKARTSAQNMIIYIKC